MTVSRRKVIGVATHVGASIMISGLIVQPVTANQVGVSLNVTAEGFRLRDEPGLAAGLAGELTLGQAVRSAGEVVEADGYRWVAIQTEDGATGWVIDAFLDDGDTRGDYPIGTELAVDRDEMNLRDAARLDSVEVVPLTRGDQAITTSAAIRRDGFTWYGVTLADGWTGYLAGEFLRPV